MSAAFRSDDEALRWSKAPEIPTIGSDYEIEVIVEGENEETSKNVQSTPIAVYRVHKAMLVNLPKRSVYFWRLFQSGEFSDAMDMSRSSVTLHKLAAEAFPTFLDFVYSPVGLDYPGQFGQLDVNVNNSAALHNLADFFQVEPLRLKVVKFWENVTMTVDECSVYLEHAQTFHNDTLKKFVVACCAEEIEKIPLNSRLLKVSTADFWLDVIQTLLEKKKFSFCVPPYAATLVAEFCIQQMNFLDVGTFEKLETVLLKKIELTFDSCVKLMQVEQKLRAPAIHEEHELTKLQSICVQQIANSWKVLWKSPENQASLKSLVFISIHKYPCCAWSSLEEKVRP